jgi:hypothetical protein
VVLVLILGLMTTTSARAQEVVSTPPRTDGLEQGYTLLADSTQDGLGLGLQDGTWEVWLGDGCGDVVAGRNVLVDRASWTLQVVDVYGPEGGTCQVMRSVQRNDVPCARNPDGVCDIGFLASGRD